MEKTRENSENAKELCSWNILQLLVTMGSVLFVKTLQQNSSLLRFLGPDQKKKLHTIFKHVATTSNMEKHFFCLPLAIWPIADVKMFIITYTLYFLDLQSRGLFTADINTMMESIKAGRKTIKEYLDMLPEMEHQKCFKELVRKMSSQFDDELEESKLWQECVFSLRSVWYYSSPYSIIRRTWQLERMLLKSATPVPLEQKVLETNTYVAQDAVIALGYSAALKVLETKSVLETKPVLKEKSKFYDTNKVRDLITGLKVGTEKSELTEKVLFPKGLQPIACIAAHMNLFLSSVRLLSAKNGQAFLDLMQVELEFIAKNYSKYCNGHQHEAMQKELEPIFHFLQRADRCR